METMEEDYNAATIKKWRRRSFYKDYQNIYERRFSIEIDNTNGKNSISSSIQVQTEIIIQKKRKRGRPRKKRSSEAGPSEAADDDLQAARLLKRLRTEEQEEVCTCDPVYEYHCRLHRCARA